MIVLLSLPCEEPKQNVKNDVVLADGPSRPGSVLSSGDRMTP